MYYLFFNYFVWLQIDMVVIDYYQYIVVFQYWMFSGQIQWYDFNIFQIDVLLDIQFGLVGEWEDVDVFVFVNLVVVVVLQFWMLIFWVLVVEMVVEGVDVFFCVGFFFVVMCVVECGVKVVFVQCLFQVFGFYDIGMFGVVVDKWVDVYCYFFWVFMYQQFIVVGFGGLVVEFIYFMEFLVGIDVQQWEWQGFWIKCFVCQMQYYVGIFFD